MTEDPRFSDADGTAALGICESLLLALVDLKIVSEQDVRDLLTDVASSHDAAATLLQPPEENSAVAAIVRRILAGKNGLRH